MSLSLETSVFPPSSTFSLKDTGTAEIGIERPAVIEGQGRTDVGALDCAEIIGVGGRTPTLEQTSVRVGTLLRGSIRVVC